MLIEQWQKKYNQIRPFASEATMPGNRRQNINLNRCTLVDVSENEEYIPFRADDIEILVRILRPILMYAKLTLERSVTR